METTRRAIKQGKIGKLVAVSVLWVLLKPSDYFQIDWRRQPGGGPVLINLIHDIDNLRYIFGEIKRVYVETSSGVREFEVEDTASVSLRFSDGALGNMVVSDAVPSDWSYEATTGENPYYFRTNDNCTCFLVRRALWLFRNCEWCVTKTLNRRDGRDGNIRWSQSISM
ncbi:MAG: hypothetical protein JSV83_05105 [Desulfobacterales bacterium]|nr:MAG: hypothetical protein JSV83_05105 [Desulfobacterales bacterium]